MSKKIKKIDISTVTERNKENLQLDSKYKDSLKHEYKKDQQEKLEDHYRGEDPYCAVDNTRCKGICRERNTKNNIFSCSEAIHKRFVVVIRNKIRKGERR